MYTKQIIDLIEQYGPEMQPGNQFFTRTVLSNEQILGAISTFARGVNPDAIIGMIDDSLKKDGTAGIVFTTSCIYFSSVRASSMSMKNALVRYCDITGAKIITKKWSDYSNVIQLDICNIPYDYYEINNITFKKEPFKKFIDALLDVLKKEDNFEKDSKPSYSVVSHYLHQRDVLMKSVLNSIRNGKKIDKKMVSITDSFGLTPLHYCIAFGDIDNAYHILKDTLKRNREMYVCRQPYGIYNYCMSIVMSGCDNFDSDKGRLFGEVFLCTDEMQKLKKEYLKALAVEKCVDVGKAIVSEMGSQTAQSFYRAVETIEQEKAKDTIDKNRQAKIEIAEEKLQSIRELEENWYQIKCKMEEKRSQRLENEDESNFVNNEHTKLGSSSEIDKNMLGMTKQYLEECKAQFSKLKEKVDSGILSEDERIPLLLHMFWDSSFIEKRLEALSGDSIILRIRYKYFMVPEYFLDMYPHLKDCIAVFN